MTNNGQMSSIHENYQQQQQQVAMDTQTQYQVLPHFVYL